MPCKRRTYSIRYSWKRIRSAKATANNDYLTLFLKPYADVESLLNARGRDIADANILVLGCGYHYPEVILWSTVAKQVIGIDVRKVFWKHGFRARYKDLRRGGKGISGSFANTIVDGLTYFRYFDELRKLLRTELNEHNQNLQTYEGSKLPFADETFDVVCSNAVLEHVTPSDLAQLANEIPRVTRPSGINYHLCHNYYSLSGAYVPNEIASAHPWGHLLGDRQVNNWLNSYGAPYLNRMLPEEIVKLLSQGIRCVAVYSVDKNHNKSETTSEFTYEGEELLNKELEKKLDNYPRKTLLTRAFLFVGVKQSV
jgi:SAM-dependent methyltransferase